MTDPVGRGAEGSPLHAQRREEASMEDVFERLAFDFLKYPAEHIRRHAVGKCRAGMMGKRQGCQFGDDVVTALVMIGHARCAVGDLHRRVRKLAVGKTRGMAEQVVHQHRAFRFDKVDRPFATDGFAFDGDFHIGQRGEIARNLIGKIETPLLYIGQRNNRGHDLGKRSQPEKRVGTQRIARLTVAIAAHPVKAFTPMREKKMRAGYLTPLDRCAQGAEDRGEVGHRIRPRPEAIARRAPS